MENVWSLVGRFFVLVAVVIFGSLWAAYVFTVLWQWFMVEGLNLQAISIPVAGGISALYAMLSVKARTEKEIKTSELVAFSVIKPLVCLAFGFIYKLFM